MALLNDVISAKSIDNLATFIIFEQPTPGFTSFIRKMRLRTDMHHHLDKLIEEKRDYLAGNENKSLDEEDIILFELDEKNKINNNFAEATF